MNQIDKSLVMLGLGAAFAAFTTAYVFGQSPKASTLK